MRWQALKISAILISVLLIQLIPVTVLANSCQCYESINGHTNDKHGECHPNISLENCAPSTFGYASSTSLNAHVEITRFITCKSYRDNSCQEAVGTQDPASKFTPCWLKSTCESAGGIWDAENKNEAPCSKYGTQDTAKCFVKTPDISLQVAIPGLNDRDAQGKPIIKGGFPAYIAAFYKFFMAALAVMAVVMVMWGGFKRIMAAGSPERVKDANTTIMGAITGVIIALLSYSLLALVNPNLVQNFGINIEKIKPEYINDDWCPEPDPTDPNKHYQCGDEATVDGRPCIGSVCLEGSGGCYKIGNTGKKLDNGKSADYKCMPKWQACEAIDADNIEELHGISAQDFWSFSGDSGAIATLNSICQAYDPNCYWVHSVNSTDGCQYYSSSAKSSACSGKTSCIELNAITPWVSKDLPISTGSNFAACGWGFCPSLSCQLTPFNTSGLNAVLLLDLVSKQWVCLPK